MRGLIVVLWRAGLGIHQALTLTETDPTERRGGLLIRHGKGDRRREVEMAADVCSPTRAAARRARKSTVWRISIVGGAGTTRRVLR
jgi:hypothetical protein